ncbi:peptidoglycan hydrolase-like protein with peptidoglycan-binding domain [Cellulosimicrobium cellulans]|uniref:peptidoglycan-binding domain-containing protein n=1 Tax=Cellulosimicrobium cellulans TaxID=1710 RepID=UPI001957BDA9|nr:peptidoglycan-binding protein [Cellulosimicrobium cellulans]MBM7818631.1 peptidoglycan hydrolase-like protein with peptidoglycan-binding domain [Cellulosimicrobium cellulans]
MAGIRRSSAVLLTSIAVGALGVGAGLFLAPPQVPDELTAASDERSSPVAPQQFDDDRTVNVTLHVSEPVALRSAATGTVTEAFAAPGQEIASGATIFDVDSEPVVALHTTVPLYRDLTQGDRGIDVQALQDELVRLGYTVDTTGYYGRGTTAAVKELQKRAGATKPTGSLALSHVMWLPAPSVVPETWTATLGTLLGAGDVGTTPAALTSVSINEVPNGLAPGPRTLTLFGSTTVLDDSGTATDPAFLAAAAATPDYRATRASDSPDTAPATTQLAEPLAALRVPPSAVFAVQGTSACIQSDGVARPVTIVGSGLGASLVTVEGEAPTTVDVGEAITADGCG